MYFCSKIAVNSGSVVCLRFSANDWNMLGRHVKIEAQESPGVSDFVHCVNVSLTGACVYSQGRTGVSA